MVVAVLAVTASSLQLGRTKVDPRHQLGAAAAAQARADEGEERLARQQAALALPSPGTPLARSPDPLAVATSPGSPSAISELASPTWSRAGGSPKHEARPGEWRCQPASGAARKGMHGFCINCNEKRVKGQCKCICLYCMGTGHADKYCPRKDAHVTTAFDQPTPEDVALAAVAEQEQGRAGRSVVARLMGQERLVAGEVEELEAVQRANEQRLRALAGELALPQAEVAEAWRANGCVDRLATAPCPCMRVHADSPASPMRAPVAAAPRCCLTARVPPACSRDFDKLAAQLQVSRGLQLQSLWRVPAAAVG